MKKITISSCAQGKEPFDDGRCFTVDNAGEMHITLTPLEVEHIIEALSSYNRKFYGPWELKESGHYWYKQTRKNRQIGYLIRRLYVAAKNAFLLKIQKNIERLDQE